MFIPAQPFFLAFRALRGLGSGLRAEGESCPSLLLAHPSSASALAWPGSCTKAACLDLVSRSTGLKGICCFSPLSCSPGRNQRIDVIRRESELGSAARKPL